METKRKNSSAGGLKVLITAGALTGSVALWSMFSSKSIEAMNKKQAAQDAANKVVPVNQPIVENTPFQPLPTTVAPTAQSLRVVNINLGNNPQPVQPAIQTIVVNTGGSAASSGSSGGSSSSSAPAPVTNTKTS
jgi:hypothetical protein